MCAGPAGQDLTGDGGRPGPPAIVVLGPWPPEPRAEGVKRVEVHGFPQARSLGDATSREEAAMRRPAGRGSRSP